MALILIVEDDRGIRDLLDETLVGEGHRTLLAENGQSSLRMAEKLQPDLILMDLMMPVLDGISAARWLKSTPDTTDIPIIVMSANPPLLRNAQDFETIGVLAKPFDLTELLELIDGCLNGHHM